MKNAVKLVFVLDQSGSMGTLREETITGFNKVLKDQRELNIETTVDLFLFNHEILREIKNKPLNGVANLVNYFPGGSTALLDAIGTAIDTVGKDLVALTENERPNKVMVIIITDGEENYSKEYSLEDIQVKVEHQTTKYSWEFLFIGANIDAFECGTNLNIGQTMQYNATAYGTKKMYTFCSSTIGTYSKSK